VRGCLRGIDRLINLFDAGADDLLLDLTGGGVEDVAAALAAGLGVLAADEVGEGVRHGCPSVRE